jgi:hypothetical protein
MKTNRLRSDGHMIRIPKEGYFLSKTAKTKAAEKIKVSEWDEQRYSGLKGLRPNLVTALHNVIQSDLK